MSTNSGALEITNQSKSFDPSRYRLNGITMGTRYSAEFYAPLGRNITALRTELQHAVDRVDAQMSPWISNSALNRLNLAAEGEWISVPEEMFTVLCRGLEIGELSDGAFDLNVGHLVNFWGFGPGKNDHERYDQKSLSYPAHLATDVDANTGMIRKRAHLSLDLCGIAKGFGVDELARTLERENIHDYIVSIDGELRASGEKPNSEPWVLSIERPDLHRRDTLIAFNGTDIALATSGDYRQRQFMNGSFVSHTMDLRTDTPVENDIASVTVAAPNCMSADAWATALLVKGLEAGIALATEHQFDAVFVQRKNSDFRCFGTGRFCDPELESHLIPR